MGDLRSSFFVGMAGLSVTRRGEKPVRGFGEFLVNEEDVWFRRELDFMPAKES